MADDVPTRQEFNAVTGSLQKQIDAQARSYENLARDTKDEIRRLAETIKPAVAPVDHGALVLQRAMDMVEKRSGRSGGVIGGGWAAAALAVLLLVAKIKGWM